MCSLKIFSIFLLVAVSVTGPAIAVQKTLQLNDIVGTQFLNQQKSQQFPLPPQQKQPKLENISFTDNAGIDPIIVGLVAN